MNNMQNRSAEITMRHTEREFSFNNTIVLTLNIHRPVVRLKGNEQAQSRINRRFSSQAVAFLRRASIVLYRQAVQQYQDSIVSDFPFRQFDAAMHFDITYNSNCHLSSFNDRYEYTGGAHGSTLRRSDTFSLKTGQRLPLMSFFPRGSNYRGMLLGQILMQADENMQQDPIYFDDYRTLIVKHFNPESYYLTDEGINIYYQQYEIAPYASGIIVFTIPYSVAGTAPSC
ncbi:MAG: DUF3298 and DUF4163 domain-containing protein [Oscillospiraceae bacterium]|jgi:hypothetical protein|nr:DUF3298 and DUF4163 domain-containing protein [Oscillospiraceae bacterium]